MPVFVTGARTGDAGLVGIRHSSRVLGVNRQINIHNVARAARQDKAAEYTLTLQKATVLEPGWPPVPAGGTPALPPPSSPCCPDHLAPSMSRDLPPSSFTLDVFDSEILEWDIFRHFLFNIEGIPSFKQSFIYF